MIAEPPKPPRGARRLSKQASTRLLASLKGYVGSGARAASDMSALIGCSKRTARRLLSLPASEVPLLKLLYAQRASRRIGVPVNKLCGAAQPETGGTPKLRLWSSDLPSIEARRVAGVFAMHLSTRIAVMYGLIADYEVRNGIDARPYEVLMYVSGVDKKRHILSFSEGEQRDRFVVKYTAPDGTKAISRSMCEDAVDKIITCIKYGKNICT